MKLPDTDYLEKPTKIFKKYLRKQATRKMTSSNYSSELQALFHIIQIGMAPFTRISRIY